MTRRGSGLHSALPMGTVRRGVVVAVAVLAPFGLAACSSGSSKSEPTKTVTNGAITVDAFDSLHFDVGTIKTAPGQLTVTLVNKGAIEHTFKIEGTPLLLKTNGGKSATGSVTLAKGTYVFECTIPGHAAQGMKGTVVVS